MLQPKYSLTPKYRNSNFEYAKYIALSYAADELVASKSIHRSVKYFEQKRKSTGKYLNLNIGVAVLEDIRKGYKANAKAGFELAMVDHAYKDWNYKGNPMGVDLVTSPNTRQWNALYMSWNLAFVSSFPDCLLYFGKLLNPAVSCTYLDESIPGNEGLFIWPRSLSLHIHICFLASLRETQLQPLTYNWNNQVITELWGSTNKMAAQLYKNSHTLKDRWLWETVFNLST